MCFRCDGKVNVKLLVILGLIVVIVGVSLVVARQAQRENFSREAKEAGEVAYATKDWAKAADQFRAYLSRNPEDVAVLRKFGEACLLTRPLNMTSISGAISAYRRILDLVPDEREPYVKLAMIYGSLGNHGELATLAQECLKKDPMDAEASLWLAEALMQLKRKDEAQKLLEQKITEWERDQALTGEYIKACIAMSKLAVADAEETEQVVDEGEKPQTPLAWLNRAVMRDPESCEALVQRARLFRSKMSEEGLSDQDKETLRSHAQRDLRTVRFLDPNEPRIRLFMGVEWLAHGELDQAAMELKSADAMPLPSDNSFYDESDWTVTRFLFASELILRRGATLEGSELAEKTLAVLSSNRHRARVLSIAIQLFVRAGRVTEARQFLDEYLELLKSHEGSAESAARLAGIQALVAGAENRPHDVIAALEPMANGETSNAGIWKLLADAYDRTDQPGRAVKALNQYRRLNPQDVKTLLELSRQYAKLGKWENVLDTVVLAESMGVSDLVLTLLRGSALINLAAKSGNAAYQGQVSQLCSELDDLSQANPDNVDVRILLANSYTYLEQLDQTVRILQKAIEECSNPLRAEIELARYWYRLQRLDQVIRVCEAACERHPEVAQAWLVLADAYMTQNDKDAARACLQKGLNTVTKASDKSVLTVKLAIMELVHGERGKGIQLLLDMIAADPQDIRARSLLLSVREIRQDPEQAQVILDGLRQAEGHSGLWWRLHQASLWLSNATWADKQEEIEALLQTCMQADPLWSAPVLLLAEMYERQRDWDKVEDVCRQGLLANPEAMDIADRLLALLEQQERFADGEKLLAKVKMSPQRVNYWQLRAALGLRNYGQAIDALKLRASNDDQDADARIQLARLTYQETGHADQALAYLKEAEAITPDSRTLIAVKASIYRDEGLKDKAMQVLDAYVQRTNSFDAFWVRAVYLTETGKMDLAEQDYLQLVQFPDNDMAGYELLSNFYAQNQRLDESIATLEKGLEKHADHTRLKRVLMQQLLMRNSSQDYERAVAILSELESEFPQDVDLMMVRASLLVQNAEPESMQKGKVLLESVVSLDPRRVEAHLMLINVAMQMGDIELASNLTHQALKAVPDHPALLTIQGRTELMQGYTRRALEVAREALQEDPNNLDALFVLSDAAQQTSEPAMLQEAQRLLNVAVVKHANNERLLLSRAHVLAALEQPLAGTPELMTYVQSEAGSKSLAAIITLADLYRLAGNIEDAQGWIARAEQIDAKNQTVVHAKTLLRFSLQRFDELEGVSSSYIQATGQDPIVVLTAARMLSSLPSQSLQAQGLALFRHAVTLAPDSLDARLGLASMLYRAKEINQAISLYQQLHEEHPENIRVLNDLAWILQEHNNGSEEALALANRGIQLAPEDLFLRDTRGHILSSIPDRFAEARDDYEMLIQLSLPESARQAKALLNLGRIFVKLDDMAQAKEYLTRAREIDKKIDVFTVEERSEIESVAQIN